MGLGCVVRCGQNSHAHAIINTLVNKIHRACAQAMHTDVYVPSTVSRRFGTETKAHCRYRVSGWPGIISKIYIQTVQKFQAYLEEIFYSIQNVLTTTGTSPDRVELLHFRAVKPRLLGGELWMLINDAQVQTTNMGTLSQILIT